MAALRSGLKCSRTKVYAPLLNRIDALPLNVSYYFLDGSYFGCGNPNADCGISIEWAGIVSG